VYPVLLKHNYTVSLSDKWHSSSYAAKTETYLCRKPHTVVEYIASKMDYMHQLSLFDNMSKFHFSFSLTLFLLNVTYYSIISWMREFLYSTWLIFLLSQKVPIFGTQDVSCLSYTSVQTTHCYRRKVWNKTIYTDCIPMPHK